MMASCSICFMRRFKNHFMDKVRKEFDVQRKNELKSRSQYANLELQILLLPRRSKDKMLSQLKIVVDQKERMQLAERNLDKMLFPPNLDIKGDESGEPNVETYESSLESLVDIDTSYRASFA